MDGRRGWVLVLDEDDGIQTWLVDMVAKVAGGHRGCRLAENPGSDVVASAAQVSPSCGCERAIQFVGHNFFRAFRTEQCGELDELVLAEVGRECPAVQAPGRAGQCEQGDVGQDFGVSWATTAGAMIDPWL